MLNKIIKQMNDYWSFLLWSFLLIVVLIFTMFYVYAILKADQQSDRDFESDCQKHNGKTIIDKNNNHYCVAKTGILAEETS